MDRKDELKERAGELKREEGGLEAERDARRTAPAEAVRPHRAGRDEAAVPGEASDEPAALGEQERAAERVAGHRPRPGDLDEKPH